jgi:hypothetical protein
MSFLASDGFFQKDFGLPFEMISLQRKTRGGKG